MTDHSLSEEDAIAVVRLVGETCILPGDHEAKKRHLMEGLARLVSADYWAWGMAAELIPGKFPVYTGFLCGGFTEQTFAEFLKIQTHPGMIHWTIPLATLFHKTGASVTRNVQDQFSYDEFVSSEVGQLWQKADIEPRCITFSPAGRGMATGIGLYRKAGSPLFTPRDALITHIVFNEVRWLQDMGWPDDRCASIPQLPPRGWLVHELLLQGYTRAKIAEYLGISTHTANDYVKQVYAHLGVNSQAGLIARFRQGDGGDRPL